MSALDTVVAVNVDGRSITLAESLHALKVQGQLEVLLEGIIEDRLIADAAAAAGVSVSDGELQEAANAYRRAQGLHRADQTRTWLEEHCLTAEDLQDRVERLVLRRKLAEHLARGQVERWFAENQAEFDRARLSQLIVAKEGLAQELLSQVQDDGADFAALARKHSLDEKSRHAGGYVGVAPRKGMAPAVEAAVFGARPGDVVGPFQTAHGFHLIRVEELLPARLDARTAETIRDRIFADWLRQHRTRARVELSLLTTV